MTSRVRESHVQDDLLSLRELVAGYDNVPVLRGVSVTIRRGEFVGIVGASGSGKTTLLRAVLGQVRRFAGDMELRGDPSLVRIGYVPQVELVDWNFPITVEEVVLLGRWRDSRWRPWYRPGDRRVARSLLDQVGIGHLAGRHIRALSGGQQQRVFIARALAGSPDLLLLDEPTSGVDIRSRHEIMHLLRAINAAGTTIVLTTHDLNAVANHLPRLLLMAHGEVLADGPPDHLITEATLERAYGAAMRVITMGDSRYVLEHSGEPSRPAPAAHRREAFRA